MSDLSGLALVGMMGSGKSTVGAMLAERLDLPEVDTDVLIEERSGSSIATIFNQVGEQGFRRVEIECLADAVASMPCVIATGGGVVTTDDGRALLGKVPLVIHLKVTPEVAAGRVGQDTSRPILSVDPLTTLRHLDHERASWYDEVADLVVVVDDKTPEEVVTWIMDHIESTK